MNPAMEASSEGGSQVFAKVLKASLEFVKRHVERCDGVQTSVGFVREHVGSVNRFQSDGVVEITFTPGAGTNLVKGLLKVHHVVDVGQFLVFSEELGVNSGPVGGFQTEVEI